MCGLSVAAPGIIAAVDYYESLQTAQHAAILLLSDTHGAIEVVQWLFSHRAVPIDACFFAGDGAGDILKVLETGGFLNSAESVPPLLVFARGNCDASQYRLPQKVHSETGIFSIPFYQTVMIANVSILLTHGHLCCVELNTNRLCAVAEQAHCALAVYGHTHIQFCQFTHKTVCINPGSPVRPRGQSAAGFAVLKLDSTGYRKTEKTLIFYTLKEDISGEFYAIEQNKQRL